ncbi:MAG: energy-coupling factor ABC transporter ATP-binding protein [Bacillota bacterium]|jgi:energy-coupling factor transport system ATP-binding protein
MTKAVIVENLSYAYEEGGQVLNDLSFALPRGSLTAIIGLSGCGKSTLCHALCGIIPQVLGGTLSGKIILDGYDIAEIPLVQLCRKIGLVMQDPDLQMVTTTVEDELAFAPENLCLEPALIRERIDEVLQLLQLEDLALKSPSKLSGGQKQLVAMGSVLTLNPTILILDEPMSHLDKNGKRLVKKALRLLQQAGKTLIMVEHDLTLAKEADLWLVMAAGRVERLDTPQAILADREFLKQQFLYQEQGVTE